MAGPCPQHTGEGLGHRVITVSAQSLIPTCWTGIAGLILSALLAGNQPLTWQDSSAETAYKELITHIGLAAHTGQEDLMDFEDQPLTNGKLAQ